MTLIDSGELIVAARFLGVAHPPGFPLYVILVYLASLLPIGNIAERINFASAFFAALACAIARDYVENIQGTIEPNSFLLTLDWQVASPMLYTREVEDRRSDIKAVDVLLLRRSWYFDYLRRAYPDMIARSRDKVDVCLAQLRHWEKDPEAYKRDAALTRQISEAFDELIHSLVSREIEVAPVYVTAELFVMGQSGDRDLIQWLNQNFQAVPRGLVFQLLRDRDFHDPGELHLQTRGLIDGTHRFDPDDVVK